jgi:hypothetical protein
MALVRSNVRLAAQIACAFAETRSSLELANHEGLAPATKNTKTKRSS